MSNNVAPNAAAASPHRVQTSLEAALAFLKGIEDNGQLNIMPDDIDGYRKISSFIQKIRQMGHIRSKIDQAVVRADKKIVKDLPRGLDLKATSNLVWMSLAEGNINNGFLQCEQHLDAFGADET